MESEKYLSICNDIIAKPDEAPVLIQSLIDMAKADGETYKSLSALNESNNERIRTLQDTNQKLFLKATTPYTTEEQGKTDEVLLDSIVKSFTGRE